MLDDQEDIPHRIHHVLTYQKSCVSFFFFCQKNSRVYCSRFPINRVINVLGGWMNVWSSNFNTQPFSVHRLNQSLDCLRSQNLEESCPLVRPFFDIDIEPETFRTFKSALSSHISRPNILSRSFLEQNVLLNGSLKFQWIVKTLEYVCLWFLGLNDLLYSLVGDHKTWLQKFKCAERKNSI